jgi:hypothetical protein
MKTRTHWTHSALKTFEQCPLKYQYSYLFEASDWKKLGYAIAPAIPSPAMQRGTDIHEDIERYLLVKQPELRHPEIAPVWAMQVADLRARGAVAEEQWEFDDGWHPDPAPANVWLRMKIDSYYFETPTVVHVIDFKTGKPYPENREQTEVYGIGAFAKFDDVETVHTALWYLDSDAPDERTYQRPQVSKLARKWEQRSGAMLNAEQYPARPNRFCRWCAFNKVNGGPCAAE